MWLSVYLNSHLMWLVGFQNIFFSKFRPELVVKKLRYYARYIVVCLLLNKMDLVKVLVKVWTLNSSKDIIQARRQKKYFCGNDWKKKVSLKRSEVSFVTQTSKKRIFSAGVIGRDWRIHTTFQHRGPAGVESGSPGGGGFCGGILSWLTQTNTCRAFCSL